MQLRHSCPSHQLKGSIHWIDRLAAPFRVVSIDMQPIMPADSKQTHENLVEISSRKILPQFSRLETTMHKRHSSHSMKLITMQTPSQRNSTSKMNIHWMHTDSTDQMMEDMRQIVDQEEITLH
uniref:Uncharacterized protein n=1 Tax=Cacopsylla melanoneura TaxID=428564 RepID=A0A8D8M676_9HEMI